MKKLITILENHGINTRINNGVLEAEEVYTKDGKTSSNWVQANAEDMTVNGMSVKFWLGY